MPLKKLWHVLVDIKSRKKLDKSIYNKYNWYYWYQQNVELPMMPDQIIQLQEIVCDVENTSQNIW